MAYLTILRTTLDRCEQCGATEPVLQFVVSQDDEDTIRLVACLICVITAMDNAMEWNMTRSFAQALANRAVGETVQAERRKEMEALNARIAETESARARLSSDAGRERGDSSVLSLRDDDTGTSESATQNSRGGNRSRGDKTDHRKAPRRR